MNIKDKNKVNYTHKFNYKNAKCLGETTKYIVTYIQR
jgi:hypothetical protein